MKSLVYMDNNATTMVAPEVRDAMLPYLTELYGNPSSMYSFGGNVGKAVERAREQVADILNAQPGEVLFTSCGTESDATAIMAALQTQPEKRHLITTKVEHPAVLSLIQHLEKQGYKVTWLGVDSKGRINLAEYESALSRDTALVSMMFANNETGVVFPIQQAAEMARAKDVLFHTDAVQAVGKLEIDMNKLPVNYLALSGHKLHAPKGIGALYVRRGTPFRPYLRGGHQEFGRRAGTEAVPSIVALGKACEMAKDLFDTESTYVKNLRDRLQEKLLATISDSRINGDTKFRLPNTLNISFKYVEGEAILLLLDQYGICASSGSACTSGSLEPSHVLRAQGVPFTYAHGSVRFSLSRYNSEEEVDYVAEKLPEIISRLREMSPYKDLPDDFTLEDSACRCSAE